MGTAATRSRTYTQTTPKVSSGQACEAAHNQVETFTCPVNCEGTWSAWTNSCAPSDMNKQRTWTTSKEPQGTGTACPAGDGETVTETCPAIDCVGAWGAWGKRNQDH